MSENKQKKGFWASLFGRNKQSEQSSTHHSQTSVEQEQSSVIDNSTTQQTEATTDNVVTTQEHIEPTAETVPNTSESSENLIPTETVVEELLQSEPEPEPSKIETQEKPTKPGFFSRLVQGLVKTKQNIGAGFLNFFSGKKIDDELFEELEEQLLIADVGVPTTSKIIDNLTEHASRKQLKDAELLYQQLKVELGAILKPTEQPLVLTDKKPFVILMVGVNGVGKTTTIGKLAKQFQQQGKSVMLAAGDTFRAAAVEQLQVWGERNHIPVIAQATGSDSASVLYDAMQSATAKGIDILIADTAGRLQNKNNLMDELRKIVRVMKKYDETAPHEIMLTLDAGTGQNAISQMKLFNEAVGITGITLTKLDGTAKGGVIFALADQFNVPIRYIGVGEKIDDLRPFKSEEFIEALFVSEKEV
ncbi:cell division protein FtsY [Gallibacterium salpingitidis]|uniref:Signal recognition particle receptor FtsY n=1 Tax=Gallibacterium salpingitidis TaxID=505341 RepID=A0AB36E5E5_9PAST|nr:signal recognition particle-docking protein FtsY [Gallibacterium salpingitidis]OBX12070.1 cell division protein FtsY [Gallibacterium salpingitidis]